MRTQGSDLNCTVQIDINPNPNLQELIKKVTRERKK